MPIEILMPALSPTMTEGKLAKWLKKEGDAVKSGDVLAEIETDKATMEMEAVDEGTMGKILVPEGTEKVQVNQPIAVLLGEGESAADVKKTAPPPPDQKTEATPVPKSPAPTGAAQIVMTAAPKPAAAPTPQVLAPKSGDRVFASPLAKRIAADAGLDLAGVQGTGPQGRVVKAD